MYLLHLLLASSCLLHYFVHFVWLQFSRCLEANGARQEIFNELVRWNKTKGLISLTCQNLVSMTLNVNCLACIAINECYNTYGYRVLCSCVIASVCSVLLASCCSMSRPLAWILNQNVFFGEWIVLFKFELQASFHVRYMYRLSR